MLQRNWCLDVCFSCKVLVKTLLLSFTARSWPKMDWKEIYKNNLNVKVWYTVILAIKEAIWSEFFELYTYMVIFCCHTRVLYITCGVKLWDFIQCQYCHFDGLLCNCCIKYSDHTYPIVISQSAWNPLQDHPLPSAVQLNHSNFQIMALKLTKKALIP